MSRMVDDLQKQGIRLKAYATGNHKTTCPRCSHTRSNKTDPCLSVTIKDGDLALWNCHHCFWQGGAGDVAGRREEAPAKKEYRRPEPPQSKPGAFPVAALEFMKARAITPEVVNRNRLYWDDRRKAICFPYYENGELVNVKYRTLDKKFQMSAGAKLILYGVDDVKDAEEIIIVEGEFDKLALEVCGLRRVVSVPNGAPARVREGEPQNDKAFEYLAHAESLFAKAKRVIIAVDADAAGANLKYELVRRIGIHKCYVVDFPTKDANDCLKELGVDVVLDCLQHAKPYPIKGLYSVGDFDKALVDYFNYGMKSGVPTGFDNLNKLWTVKPGETTVFTGVPNAGKSEFVDAIMINLAKNENWKAAIFSPEHKKEQHVAKLVEKIVGLPTSPKDPNRMSIDQFMNGVSWVDRFFHFIIADDYDDLPNLDWVLERATAAVYRQGIKLFLIDPWNELQLPEPKRGVSETDHIGHAIAKVMRWGKRHDVANFIIAHPAKIAADKDGKTRAPVLYDIHGSAHWVNKPDNGLVIHLSEDASNTTDIYVRKVRDKHVGQRGNCSLKYDKPTGSYSVPPKNYNYKRHEEADMQVYEA